MLIINEENLDMIKKLTSVRAVLNSGNEVMLDLPHDQIVLLAEEGVPTTEILRSWTRCTKEYIDRIGIDVLTYSDMEAIVCNPAVANLALEHKRFMQVLPKPIFANALANISYEDCKKYDIDILVAMQMETITPEVKRKLIDDAFKSKLFPISNIQNIVDISATTITFELACNIIDIKYPKLLVDKSMITNDIVRNSRLYIGLMSLLSAGPYSSEYFNLLREFCDKYTKFDNIRTLPIIPDVAETTEWFKLCEESAATIKYVATCGIFTDTTLQMFVDIVERVGCMADMLLLFENVRLSKEQKIKVRTYCDPAIQVVDYRPALFNTYITKGEQSDIIDFVKTYSQYPSAMLMLQSPEALAISGAYYLYHIQHNKEFLICYLLRTNNVKYSDKIINKLTSVVNRCNSVDASTLFILATNIPIEAKRKITLQP